MKALAITLALAALAATAPLNAQILGRIPTSQTTVNGSWTLVGRDGNGNQIYERRTQDRNGNIVVQRARRDANGNLSIISTNTVNTGNNGNNRNDDCNYSQTTNTVGDIIFGRTGNNSTNCDDRNSRATGGWYQVGRDGNGNRIYERRTTDINGNVIIQRARRNSNGSFSVISTRNVGSVNGNNGRRNRGRGDDGDDEQDNRNGKKHNKDNRGNGDDRGRDHDRD